MEQVPGFMVFWMQIDSVFADRHMRASARHFEPNEMSSALAFVEALRKEGLAQFVTMASQDANSVGKPGVDAVVDNKTPDGEDYEWSKAGRAGKPKRSER
jgi:hypothetical protein